MAEVEFFSPKVLAQKWSCSRNHIYDLIAEGKLKAIKWGGRSVKIHFAEVERFGKEMLRCDLERVAEGHTIEAVSGLRL